MQIQKKLTVILSELKNHAPFTLFGASTGLVCMLLFKNVGPVINHRLFQVFHPGHVILSAIVTASLYRLYESKASFIKIFLIGYFGAIGIATLSDCILPFFGESILGVAIPVHADLHEHNTVAGHDNKLQEDAHGNEEDIHYEDGLESEKNDKTPGIRARLHLGFIEDWYLVNPAAFLGILIAYFRPRTRFPHAGHVLISTWASSFHVLMNTNRELTAVMLFGVFVVLFIAVWLPCCVSDIVFPLLFVGSDKDLSNVLHHH
ncbi:MAG: hypothetical protein JXA81_01020 [Sedimentisphaerales bacterium]|nr:hypothetical protein [Sedimentisphaerales bacterium]